MNIASPMDFGPPITFCYFALLAHLTSLLIATSHTSWLKTRRVLSISLAILRDSISCLPGYIRTIENSEDGFLGKNARVRKSEVKVKHWPEIDKPIVHLYDDNNCRIWNWAESFLVPQYLLFCSDINLFYPDISTYFDINLIILCFNLRPDCSWPHRYSSGCLQCWSEKTNLYLSRPRAANASH